MSKKLKKLNLIHFKAIIILKSTLHYILTQPANSGTEFYKCNVNKAVQFQHLYWIRLLELGGNKDSNNWWLGFCQF
jgi:hypothetical protein